VECPVDRVLGVFSLVLTKWHGWWWLGAPGDGLAEVVFLCLHVCFVFGGGSLTGVWTYELPELKLHDDCYS